jgi:hypothetical protein
VFGGLSMTTKSTFESMFDKCSSMVKVDFGKSGFRLLHMPAR